MNISVSIEIFCSELLSQFGYHRLRKELLPCQIAIDG